MIEHPGERPQDRPPMEAERLAEFLAHMNLTPNEAGRLWSIDPRRIRHMVAGKSPIPPLYEVFLLNVTALGLILNSLERHFTLTGTRPVGFGPLQQLAEDALERATGKRRVDDGQRARNP